MTTEPAQQTKDDSTPSDSNDDKPAVPTPPPTEAEAEEQETIAHYVYDFMFGGLNANRA